ncbi:amidase domain-containing protein [Phthorimaea operculella]|nr:amidase domain-containing protein [Phthorimaea operculella]
MKSVLIWLRVLLDNILDFIFSLYWERKKKPVPDLDKKYAFLAESATTLAKKIRNKELKAEELMQAVILRIKQVNPIINAVAEERFAKALDEARKVDMRIEAGLPDEEFNKKPFLGVPFTTKECQEVKDMKCTMGLWARRHNVAKEDSEAVRRLKLAGAIPVASSNLPELLIWQETRNPVYGTTNNPHHTGRSAGGSSGGEAALAATYASTISLCSDIGGSTRMPAFYCGMFGYQPTAGTINMRGIVWRKGDEDSMAALGFISKHAEDLGPLIKVIAGDKAGLLKLDRDIDVKNLKFYYTKGSSDCLVSPIDPEIKAAMCSVVAKISEQVKRSDDSPKPYSHKGFNHMFRLWSHMVTKEPDDHYGIWYSNFGEKANGFLELLKKLCGMNGRHNFFTILRLLELQVLPEPNKIWAENLLRSLKEDLIKTLGDNGVLLFPSAPLAAPYHYEAVVRPFNFSYWAINNALKFPCVQVPLGRNRQGLPIGIQVVSAPYNDALCLAVAKYLEKEFGGAVFPCKIKSG